MIGKTLSRYRITDKLGEGGMGEVYRATDTKLNGDVALKILPEGFADHPQRPASFRREAQALTALNHCNIGHIYEIEDTGRTKVLVPELVEGPTIPDRIAQGPIVLDTALPIALQITEALEAHWRGGIP